MSLYCHQVRNTKASKVYLLCILGIFSAGFGNKVAKLVLPSCGTFTLMHFFRDLHYLTEEEKKLTATDVDIN